MRWTGSEDGEITITDEFDGGPPADEDEPLPDVPSDEEAPQAEVIQGKEHSSE